MRTLWRVGERAPPRRFNDLVNPKENLAVGDLESDTVHISSRRSGGVAAETVKLLSMFGTLEVVPQRAVPDPVISNMLSVPHKGNRAVVGGDDEHVAVLEIDHPVL